jgi:cupin 2 domain-containing protein
MNAKNIFDGIPSELADELFTTIHCGNTFAIERIVSQGHCSPEGFWYDQNENEWLIVLQGNATVQFDGSQESVELCEGSYLNIPAHKRHRVVQTDMNRQTMWLAIHYKE